MDQVREILYVMNIDSKGLYCLVIKQDLLYGKPYKKEDMYNSELSAYANGKEMIIKIHVNEW